MNSSSGYEIVNDGIFINNMKKCILKFMLDEYQIVDILQPYFEGEPVLR